MASNNPSNSQKILYTPSGVPYHPTTQVDPDYGDKIHEYERVDTVKNSTSVEQKIKIPYNPSFRIEDSGLPTSKKDTTESRISNHSKGVNIPKKSSKDSGISSRHKDSGKSHKPKEVKYTRSYLVLSLEFLAHMWIFYVIYVIFTHVPSKVGMSFEPLDPMGSLCSIDDKGLQTKNQSTSKGIRNPPTQLVSRIPFYFSTQCSLITNTNIVLQCQNPYFYIDMALNGIRKTKVNLNQDSTNTRVPYLAYDKISTPYERRFRDNSRYVDYHSSTITGNNKYYHPCWASQIKMVFADYTNVTHIYSGFIGTFNSQSKLGKAIRDLSQINCVFIQSEKILMFQFENNDMMYLKSIEV